MDDSAHGWDERYAEPLWSGRPNGVLQLEVQPTQPGRALDIGCGEGADAMWLAAQGWAVTAVDISQVAIDRCVAAAESAGVAVEWLCADVVTTPPPAGAFDLVSVHYPAFRHTDDDAAIHAMIDAVAPGGTLLVVGHASLDPDFRPHGFDPADYVQPTDVARRLTAGWTVLTNENRPRVDPTPEGVAFTHDAVLVAVRS